MAQPARYPAGLQALGQDVSAWLSPNGGWGESNAALISGAGASLLVDTLWDLKHTAAMLTALAPTLQAAPVGRLVNTHADGDHWFGNELAQSPEIVSTAAAARAMRRHGPGTMASLGKLPALYRMLSHGPLPHRGQWRVAADYLDEMLRPFDFRGIRPVRPTHTFTGELRLEVGGREVRLIEVGPAHTSGDLVVYLPDGRMLFAGDIIFLGTTPILWDGSARNWIQACERILDLGAETVIPGHGAVTGPNGVEAVRNYWQFLSTAVQRHVERGNSPLLAARSILRSDEYQRQPFAKWDGQERIVINVYALYGRGMGTWQRLKLLRQAAVLARELMKE